MSVGEVSREVISTGCVCEVHGETISEIMLHGRRCVRGVSSRLGLERGGLRREARESASRWGHGKTHSRRLTPSGSLRRAHCGRLRSSPFARYPGTPFSVFIRFLFSVSKRGMQSRAQRGEATATAPAGSSRGRATRPSNSLTHNGTQGWCRRPTCTPTVAQITCWSRAEALEHPFVRAR